MKRVSLITLCLLLSASSPSFAQQSPTGARDLFTNFGQEQNQEQQQNTVQRRRVRRKARSEGRPGTKVTIELNRGGQISRVSPRAVFRSGDRIRFHFKTNFRGYIAVINEGTTGRQNLLFPYPGVSNEVTPTSDYMIPKEGSWILFDDNAGTERVVFIMSKNRIPELQRFLASAPGTVASATGPAANENEVLAALNNRAMGRTRDLTVEVQGNDAYALTAIQHLSSPIGFRLSLKHR